MRHVPSQGTFPQNASRVTYLILCYGTTYMHRMRANIFGFRVTPQIITCLSAIYGLLTLLFLHRTTHCRYVALPCGLSVGY